MKKEKKIIEEEKKEIVEESTIKEETLVKKEDKFKKVRELFKNKKVIVGVLGGIILVILLLLGVTKTDVVNNLLGIEEDTTSRITSITYQGKNKYQIESTSKFLVETKNIGKDDLNKYLAIEPAYNYTIETKGKNKFEITIENIEADKIVNIDFVNNEKIDKKWAFQSSNEYKVSSTYPANKSNDVLTSTGIDISFTRSGTILGDFKKHFVIEPKVEGEFSSYGRTITFVPKEELKANTNYVITITKGLKSGDDVIDKDYMFSFTTYGSDNSGANIANDNVTIDNISTFKASDLPKIAVTYNSNTFGYYDMYADREEDEEISYKSIDKVVVEKFSSSSDFEKYINGNTSIKRESLGNYKFHKYNRKTIEFDNKLAVGYYLFDVYAKNNKLLFQIPVQVNNLSAFLMNSERDVIVWVANNGAFAENVEISYEGKKEKTNSDGIAIIKNISDGSYNTKYVKINNDSKTPIFVGITNYSLNNYPYGYIYTDRPLYKNTDEIKVWGYVPLEFFADDVDRDKFSIIFNEKNIPVKVDDQGNFETKIDINNIASDYYYITLKYNNTEIAYRDVTVENYQLQNYIYEISTDKEYIEAGGKIKVNIKVKHVSNLPASNKDVSITFCDKTYKGKTNQAGEVTFNITAIKNEDYYDRNVAYEDVEILGTAQDSEDWNITYPIYVIYNKVSLTEEKYNEDKKLFELKAYYLDLTKELDPDLEIEASLRGKPYNGTARVVLVERSEKKKESKEYDEFTKQNKTTYYWGDETESEVVNKNINVSNGALSYKVDYEYKKSTSNEIYYYELYVYLKDVNGHEIGAHEWLYSGYYDLDEDKVNEPNEVEAILGEGDSAYDLYEYQLRSLEDEDNYWYIKNYSVGAKINNKLLDKNDNVISNNNKVLQIKYRERIISNIINESNDVSLTYEKKDIPGVDITGAYFDGKNFYRLPSNYYKYNEEDSKINVSINPNKKEYSPKEEVEVKIKTVDSNGNPIKSNLNISVVNEGIFNVASDDTDILDTIYNYRYFSSYTFSTYRNYALVSFRGGAGGESGGGRHDFGDTIYFDSVSTDSNGVATVKFKLNDSVTSFRITVHATTKEGNVGVSHTKISSTLPLAIESNAPTFVKSSDDLVINTTSLAPKSKNDKVKYLVELKGLNKKVEKIAIPGQIVYANFGKLKVGKYTVRITATQGKLKDIVEYPVEIIESANEIKMVSENNIKDVKSIKPTKNPIYVEIYPSYLSKYLTYLDQLRNYTERLDTKIAYYKALEYEKDFYNTENIISVEDFSKYKTENKLKPLINAEGDYILTALSLYYTNYFDISSEPYYNQTDWVGEPLIDDYGKRLLVLAAKHEPVLYDLNNYVPQTNDDYIYLALAYCFLGDYDEAEKIYNKHLTSNIEEDFRSLVAIVETFIARDKAETTINNILSSKSSDNYISFAIISYFENNQDELLHNEEVTVTHGDKREKLIVDKYNVNRLVLYDNDLKDITFESKSKDINVAYYYVGKVSEMGDKVVKNIKLSLTGNNNIGNTMYLNIDISKIKKGYDNIYVYLPANLALSPKSSNLKNVSVYKVLENKVIVSLSNSSPDKISIPLIVKLPGKYTFESVILERDGKYNISNEVTFETK